MYAKEYNTQFHHAGSGCLAGRMLCKTCGEKVNSNSDDWMQSTKDDPECDWVFVVRHRKCAKSDDGWLKIEAERDTYTAEVGQISEVLSKYKNDRGEFTGAFMEALENSGFEF